MNRDKRYAAYLAVAFSFLIFFAMGNHLASTARPGAAPAAALTTPLLSDPFPGFPIDLNTASKEDLMTLPGIGEKTAARIIEERERAGGFGSLEDLTRVRYIGEAKIARLRGLVTIRASYNAGD